jgi:DNA mismatch endonuclease (patch repair protein)
MAKVKGKGNRSTEIVVEAALSANRIAGWEKHPIAVIGRPDFYFRSVRLALFVDGCFWHACPKCGRIPKTRTRFWETKITENRKRDLRKRRQLRNSGFATMRVWEHELKQTSWLKRLKARIAKLATSGRLAR